MRIKEELEAAESAVSDEETIMTLIQGISSYYENYVQCLIAGKKSDVLNSDDIIDNFLSEDKRRNHKNDKGDEENETVQKSFIKANKKVKWFSCN